MPRGRPKKAQAVATLEKKAAKEPKQKKAPLTVQDIDARLNDCSGLTFFSSGCTPQDMALGGGWALSRMSSIEGSKSTGKTGLCIEAMASFAHSHPGKPIWYHDAEGAFTEAYAQHLGLPKSLQFTALPHRQDVVSLQEYSDFYKAELEKLPDGYGGLMILDSMDAMQSKAQLDMKSLEDEKMVKAQRAGVISSMCKTLIPLLLVKNVHWMVVQQLRANVGGMGNITANGNAIGFYASQMVRVYPEGEITKTIQGNERSVGVKVRVKTKKSKVGLPYRECHYNVMYFYGIDDILACLEWIQSQSSKVNWFARLEHVAQKVNSQTGEVTYSFDNVISNLEKCEDVADYDAKCQFIKDKTKQIWQEIESAFLPTRVKYI